MTSYSLMMLILDLLRLIVTRLDGGDCFDVHGRAVLFDPKYAEAKLVHCIAVLTRPPFKEFVHCFIEIDGIAIDFSNGHNVMVPIDRYQAVGRIKKENCIKYTKEEVGRLAIKTGHWGCWDKKFEGYL